MLRSIYVIAIGLLFAAFIGLGVTTFYKAPTAPAYDYSKQSTQDYPNSLNDQANQDYTNKLNIYDRNLSIIFIIASTIVILISLWGLGKIELIGDGITLGGVFLLFAGIIFSISANNEVFRFIAITVALVMVLFLTYWKFIRNSNLKES